MFIKCSWIFLSIIIHFLIVLLAIIILPNTEAFLLKEENEQYLKWFATAALLIELLNDSSWFEVSVIYEIAQEFKLDIFSRDICNFVC